MREGGREGERQQGDILMYHTTRRHATRRDGTNTRRTHTGQKAYTQKDTLHNQPAGGAETKRSYRAGRDGQRVQEVEWMRVSFGLSSKPGRLTAQPPPPQPSLSSPRHASRETALLSHPAQADITWSAG